MLITIKPGVISHENRQLGNKIWKHFLFTTDVINVVAVCWLLNQQWAPKISQFYITVDDVSMVVLEYSFSLINIFNKT